MLTLHSHPLASFCWKALIALYENDTPFVPHIVDLADEAERAEFLKLSPLGKMPVLRDEARGRNVTESTILVEYLDAFYPGAVRFIPADAEAAWNVRMWDRFYDLYVQFPMQKIVTDRLRAPSQAGMRTASTGRRQSFARPMRSSSDIWQRAGGRLAANSPWQAVPPAPHFFMPTRSSRLPPATNISRPISIA